MSGPELPEGRKRWRLRIGLRWTLLIALLPLLTLPWVGLRFVERMSDLMRNDRLENLGMTASSLAATLHERRTLFGSAPTIDTLPAGAQALPTALLAQVHADARDDDWSDVPRQTLTVSPRGDALPSTLGLRIAVARSQEDPKTLTVRIEAKDERLVPAFDDSGTPAPGDRVRIDSGDSPGALRSLTIVAVPAQARAAQPDVPPPPGGIAPAPALPTPTRLIARSDGWFTQVALPGDPALLRIWVEDVDYLGSRKLEAVADSGLLAPVRTARGPDGGAALALSGAWAEAGRALDRAPGRLTVHDALGRVLYRHENAASAVRTADDWTSKIARSILTAASRTQPEHLFARGDPATGAGAPPGSSALSPLASALAGVPASQAQRVGTQAGLPAWRLASAHPIWIGEQAIGALVIEEESTARHAPGQRALERLALLAALAVCATVGSLLLVATLTVGRIVRLRNQAEAAIDARGRVVGTISGSRLHDELSDLGAGYQRVLHRLREHQDYLGNLRSRLVHELRTPIMVVRSSLENLVDAIDDPGQRGAYVERVRVGTDRLERIVSSMGEASSLEAMLANSRLESIDLVALLEGCTTGYRDTFRNHSFELQTDAGPRLCAVVPEAIVQALDKLVSNAVDFAPPGSTIRLSLSQTTCSTQDRRTPGWLITVNNQGPPLPATMQASLFDSMVSLRPERAGESTHLGLGLYLVRLIAEFHGGHAFARNVADGVQAGLAIRAHAPPREKQRE
jgi:two-component system sensor histidine kinase ChvG